MNDALRPTDPITAALIDAVNASEMTRREIAERVGISESTLHRKLTLKRVFTYAEAERLARVLRLNLVEAMKKQEQS